MRSGGRVLRGGSVLLLAAALGCDDGSAGAGAPTAGSSRSDGGAPSLFVDSDGDTLRFERPPERILALVPAVNEVLIDLGEGELLVGRTRYDNAPELADLPSVGEGLGPDLEAVVALEPDLVIRFGGPTDRETPARLDRLGIPNAAVRPDRIADIRKLFLELGRLVGREERAAARVAALDATLDSLARSVAGRDPVRAAYLLGTTPPWAAGPESWIGELVALGGGELYPRDLVPPSYAQISPEALIAADLEVVLVSEGGSLDPRLAEGRRVERVPDWVEVPGPHLREAARVIVGLLHPDLRDHPDLRGAPAGRER